MPAHIGDGFSFSSKLFEDNSIVELNLVDYLGGIDHGGQRINQGKADQ